mmetsp:Transcript_1977/g.3143  ORF Transcript_1977/g.3143 Transcript_1977/m.3143 type:complete len:286 (-) Transcript_1977:556-1413(-)
MLHAEKQCPEKIRAGFRVLEPLVFPHAKHVTVTPGAPPPGRSRRRRGLVLTVQAAGTEPRALHHGPRPEIAHSTLEPVTPRPSARDPRPRRWTRRRCERPTHIAPNQSARAHARRTRAGALPARRPWPVPGLSPSSPGHGRPRLLRPASFSRLSEENARTAPSHAHLSHSRLSCTTVSRKSEQARACAPPRPSALDSCRPAGKPHIARHPSAAVRSGNPTRRAPMVFTCGASLRTRRRARSRASSGMAARGGSPPTSQASPHGTRRCTRRTSRPARRLPGASIPE